MNNLRSWKRTWKIQVWLTERCVRLSQRPRFGSRSILNFFGFFFNRFGCSFYCEDPVHFHTLSNLVWLYASGSDNFKYRRHINRLRLPKKTKELSLEERKVAFIYFWTLKRTGKDCSFRSRSIETHRWMALRTVNQVNKWVDWAVLILGASSGHACLSNLSFI